MEAKIGSIVPYYGAKRKRILLDRIRRAIGRPVVLVDACCGSCAVSFGCEADVHVVNDLNQDIYNLLRCLSNEELCSRLIAEFSSFSMCEEFFDAIVSFLGGSNQRFSEMVQNNEFSAERAAAYLFVSWTGHNGFAGTINVEPYFNVRFTGGGGDPATRLASVLESIPPWYEKIREWTILRRDVFGLLDEMKKDKRDSESTTIYLDPPYHPDSRSNAQYIHEFKAKSLFNPEDDHERLEASLKEFKRSNVVVSYYDCDEIRRIYGKGWNIELVETDKSIGNTSGEASAAPEIIITRKR